MLNKAVSKLKKKMSDRKSVKELNSLSDSTLKDIGIPRGQIKHTVKNPDDNLRNK